MSVIQQVPPAWRDQVTGRVRLDEIARADALLSSERNSAARVLPAAGDLFAALALTPPDAVRVVIVGQDPYHGPGQAHGLCFSVRRGVRTPPSLANILKELTADLGLPRPAHGCLESWARQGVLLINSVLTVREGEAGSHRGHGWEALTDAIIEAVAARAVPSVFILWGKHAAAKRPAIERAAAGVRHLILTAPHPSPLSAHRGFFGSRPFSQANAFLAAAGRGAIDWRLPAMDD